MAQIDAILQSAVENRISDIHFSAGETVWARLDGDLVAFSDAPISHEDLEPMLFELLSDAEKAHLSEHKNLDKSYFIEGLGNFRVNIFYTRRGIGSVIRTLPSKIPSIEDLGLPSVVKSLAELPKGLILVTGPTGSGKSTTLAAIINHMNVNFPYHILTAEDPVEFIHVSKKSLINQREIGHSCPTFAQALKYALREDPDVILVGELRDLETISLAMTAAETGHLVLGTLHTRGAASTIDRVIESFPAVQQPMIRAMLAESLQAVISQTLVKRADGKGRVAAYEIMLMNYAISNLVREGKTFQITSAIQTGRKEGMILMENHLRELASAGEIASAEAESIIASISRGGNQQNKSGGAPTAAPGAPPPMRAGSAPNAAPPVAAPTVPVKAPVAPSAPAVKPPLAAPAAPKPVVAPPAAVKPAAAPPLPKVPTEPPIPSAAKPPPAKPTAPPLLTDLTPPPKAPDLVSNSDMLTLDDSDSDLSELTFDIGSQAESPPKLQATKPAMKFKPLGSIPEVPAVAKPATAIPVKPPLPIKKTG